MRTAAARALRRVAAAVLAGWVGGLALAALPAAAAVVEGRALIRERIALPPQAVFEAVVLDTARAGAPAEVLGRARREPAGQSPFAFRIEVDDAKLLPRGRYTLRASVLVDGRLRWTTDTIVPVFVAGAAAPQPAVELRLVPVGAAAAAPPPPFAGQRFRGELPGAGGPMRWQIDFSADGRYALRQTFADRPGPNAFDDIGRWRHDPRSGRITLRGGREAPVFLRAEADGTLLKLDLEGRPIDSPHNHRLQPAPDAPPLEPRLFAPGEFRYLADAPNLTLCVDGRRLPVAMEGEAYVALERAYREANERQGTTPGSPLLASAELRIALRPAMEAGRLPEPTVVVERFVGVFPGRGCRGAPAAARAGGPPR